MTLQDSTKHLLGYPSGHEVRYLLPVGEAMDRSRCQSYEEEMISYLFTFIFRHCYNKINWCYDQPIVPPIRIDTVLINIAERDRERQTMTDSDRK